jgi:hypothetical protein
LEHRKGRDYSGLVRALFQVCDGMGVALDEADEVDAALYEDLRKVLIATVRVLDRCRGQLER